MCWRFIGTNSSKSICRTHPEFNEGDTALHLASRKGDLGIIKFLLSLKAMVDAAEGRPLTFHRAFDGFTNPLETADTLADLGFHSILTAGGHGGAADNHPALADLVTKTQGNIQIIVGGGVRATNIADLHRQTQATMFHSSLDRNPTGEAVDQLLQSLHENS